MIYVKLEGHDFRYQIEHIIKIFYREEEIRFVEETTVDDGGIFVFSGIVSDNGQEQISSFIRVGEECSSIKEAVKDLPFGNYDMNNKKIIKKALQRQLYNLLKEKTGTPQPWGMMTGIRPAKIVHEMLDKGYDKNRILKTLNKFYMVSEEKSKLLFSVAEAEKAILEDTDHKSISLYIGMPFCPSRCLYCSFTSNPIGKYHKLVGKYIDTLKVEIEGVSEIIKSKDYVVQSIYFGGGTPTSIDHVSLKILLDFIEEKFDLSKINEYTLEAGRPDSIDQEKLEIIKASHVDRISINPQTMNNETLRLIGRNHTAEDIISSFQLARDIGFNNINMDLIIGLPGEDVKMYKNTLEEICKLSPESLTVHTMAIKRASRLVEDKLQYNLTDSNEASKMIDLTQDYAKHMKMHPYYLYRQKNMLGNLENVGYCKPGFESVYNIQIMEEKQTIIALGAGAITKVVFSEENRIERAFNVKNVEEYIKRVDEMLERKRQLIFS